MSERWPGHQRQCRRGARGDQKGILAHRAQGLPGTRLAALQQNGARKRGPKDRALMLLPRLWLPLWLRSTAARFMSYVLYKT